MENSECGRAPISDAELLAIEFQTAFVFDQPARISTRNDPDRSLAPKFVLCGCRSGNVYGVRADVPDGIAAELMALAASQRPLVEPSAAQQLVDRGIELLSRDASVPKLRIETTYLLPNDLSFRHDVPLISSDTVAGRELRASLAARGMPAGLARMGFVNVAELWEPWCAALHDGDVVSVAFAARLSATGAILGVATAPALRGRGYAAAATAGWTHMPALRSRALFYSTEQTNISSQRVVARLGLRRLGASLELF
jgi:hypothetical protein